MTPAGFPHSDTFGSKPSRRLPEAFRSQTRPSSAPGAKASTVSPCSLDYRCSRSLSSSQGARRLAPPELNSVPGRLFALSDRVPLRPHGSGEDVLTNGSNELACRVASAPTWSLPIVGTCVRPDRSAKWLLRKEVIQPHLPVRLPCYDFTPIASPTFDGSLPKGWATGFGCCPLSWCDGRCVQGPGTYSPQHC
jgi:hypothetical protein